MDTDKHMSARKRGLGKGLDLLLSTSNNARQRQVEQDTKADSNQQVVDQNRGDLRKLPIEWLHPGKYQPRKDMSAEALEELAHSIESQGLFSPLWYVKSAKIVLKLLLVNVVGALLNKLTYTMFLV